MIVKIQHFLLPKILRALNKFFWPAPKSEVLVLKEDKVLVIKSEENLFLPGGRLKAGETFAEAAEREALEETGLKVKIGEELVRYDNEVGDKVFQFSAELDVGEDADKLSGSWEGKPLWMPIKKLENYRIKFKDSKIQKTD